MYKNASRNLQRAASSFIMGKIFGGEQKLTDQEQLESLKASYKRLVEINNAETDKKQKKIYGRQLQELNLQLGMYRDRMKANKPVDQVGDYIIQMFKERCSKDEWVEVITEAKRRALQ
jgi:hypothetical protein